ncbi:MAG: 5-oxoprolinase subunit PxpA [Sphingomonadales bacterium]
MQPTIDINCDLGEETGIEAAIMPYITTANIACGAHAGNLTTIFNTIELAKKFGVAIGAHPSYPDRENFGRLVMSIDDSTLVRSISEQINAVAAIANQADYPIGHIKFHGALYNEAAKNKTVAEILVKTIASLNPSWVLYGPPASELEKAAHTHTIAYCREGFLDRTYQDDGSLTPRSDPQALITSETKSIQQALQMIRQQTVTTLSGKTISLPVQTLCLHGDGPHALPIAKTLRSELNKETITTRAAYDRIN